MRRQRAAARGPGQKCLNSQAMDRSGPPIQARKSRHGIVSANHNTAQLPPSDRRPALRKENPALARSFRFRIPQPPAPRGRRDRACSQDSLSPLGQRELVLFLFGGCRHWIGRLSAPRQGAIASRDDDPAADLQPAPHSLATGEFATAILAAPDLKSIHPRPPPALIRAAPENG